ncbi:MAG: hypothetical protein KY468_01770, partial [Armatimonadetes bacterium]|nr:hypothetical protein [Armatimonadota bacterium]
VDENVQPFSAAKDVIANLQELQKSEPKPSLTNSRELDLLINEYTAAVKKDPTNRKATTDLATALYLKGRNVMLDDWLTPGLRYPMALKFFDDALKYNPNLVAAQEDKAAVEARLKEQK